MEWTRPPLPQPPDRTLNDPRPRQGCISLSCTVRCSLQPPFAGHGSLIETCFVPTKGNSSKERQSPSNSHQTNPHHPNPHTHPSNIAPIVPLGQGRAVPGRISRLCARPSGSTTHLDTCLISLPTRTRVVRRNRSNSPFSPATCATPFPRCFVTYPPHFLHHLLPERWSSGNLYLPMSSFETAKITIVVSCHSSACQVRIDRFHCFGST